MNKGKLCEAEVWNGFDIYGCKRKARYIALGGKRYCWQHKPLASKEIEEEEEAGK